MYFLPCHLQIDTDLDPDPRFLFDADPDPRVQKKAQNLEKMLKLDNIPYILAFHLQIDADPDPTFQFDVVPDPGPQHYF